MKNKRKLKRWVKVAIGIIIVNIILILAVLGYARRIEFFNNNIEYCGSNYCEEVR